MKILFIYSVLTYIGGAFTIHKKVNMSKEMNAKDVFILLLSPLSITPILMMPIISSFVNMNYILFKLK